MSSGSESDEEYVPGEQEQLSEEGSADEDTDLQFEQEQEYKSKKRKAIQASKGKKKQRTRKTVSETVHEQEDNNVEGSEEVTNPEEEKKREEELWAKFLEGTDSKPKSVDKESQPIKSNGQSTMSVVETNKEKKQSNKIHDDKERERRIFEFAGETIVVENDVIKEKIKTSDSAVIANKLEGPSSGGRAPAGVSGVLSKLNKKNQLSTLEKSKLDWVTFKKQEGIEEEIASHNKGKAGYLDRQDFLERADLRQYEIERDLRMSRRSKR